MSKRHRTGTYRRGCLLSVFDATAVETWLEDLARRGERFTGSQGLWVLLEPDEPRVCRFRLQPLRRRKEAMDPERLAAYRTLGWTLAGQLQGVFWVWRCDDPAAPELDTDPVVQGEGYRYLRERMFRSRLVLLALLAAAVGLYLLHGFSMWTLLLGIVEDSLPGYLLCTALCVVLGAVQIGLDIRDLRRLWRTLTAGVPLERPRPYRLARALGAAAGALLVVFYGMFCINMVLTNGSGPHFARQAHRQGAPEPGVVYVDLRTLDGRDDVSYHIVRTKVHELCPRMYETRQRSLGVGKGDSYPHSALNDGHFQDTAVQVGRFHHLLSSSACSACASTDGISLTRLSRMSFSGRISLHSPAICPIITEPVFMSPSNTARRSPPSVSFSSSSRLAASASSLIY